MKHIIAYLLMLMPMVALAQNNTPVVVEQDPIFQVVEQMPDFPGGQSAMIQYIVKNVRYPAEAQKNEIQGTVYVRFIVDKQGKIVDAQLVRKVNDLLDAEALRVVKEMPTWIPGKQNGKPVSVYYTLPIKFKL